MIDKNNEKQIQENDQRLLEPGLSYRVRGVFIEASKKYGHLHKEQVYHNACAEIFRLNNISFISQPKIDIISLDSGKRLSVYIPDFLVEDKIIVELKALEFMSQALINQLEQYLKASKYEIGFLVNFGVPRVEIIRRIYTNDLKPHIRESSVDYP